MIRDRRFWLLFAAALAVRVALMPLPEPIDFDLVYFLFPWMRFSATHSIVEFYLYGEPLVNYPPLFVVLLSGLSKLYGQLVPSLEVTPLQYVLIKLPSAVADMATGVVIYLAAAGIEQRRGKTGSRLPLLAAGLWLLNPAVIYVSSVWGQFEAIQALWMMAALLAGATKRWGWSGIFMGLALLTKTQAITIAPLLALLALWSGWRALLRWGGAVAAMMAVGLLPFWFGGAAQSLRSLYVDAVGYYPAMSMNAYNPWFIAHIRSRELLGYWVEDSTALLGPVTIRHVGMALVIAYGLLVVFVLYRRWRASGQPSAEADAAQQIGTFFAAGLLIFGFFMLATEMHERYILPALAPLAVAAALLRPTRLPFVLLSATVFLNLIHVLPLARGQIQLMEALPDIRFALSAANTALLVWWTWLFVRGKRTRKKSGW